MGGFLLVAKDFEGPDIPSEELRERMYLRRRRMVRNAVVLLRRLLHLSRHPNSSEEVDVEIRGDFKKEDNDPFNGGAGKDERIDQNAIAEKTIPPMATSSTFELSQLPTDRSAHSHYHDLLSRLRRFLKQVLHPCTVVIVISFVVALVDPLKALFIPPSSDFQPHFRPTAPDGQPPLAFIFDTATFIGAACVPLILLCLGSAFASLSLKSGEIFPRGAVASFTLGKMVIIPIIGIAITKGFVHVGFVNPDDKVLQFVCLCVV